jgi:hypothetical protein
LVLSFVYFLFFSFFFLKKANKAKHLSLLSLSLPRSLLFIYLPPSQRRQTSGTFSTRRHTFSTSSSTLSTTAPAPLALTVSATERVVLGGATLVAATRFYNAKTAAATATTAAATKLALTVLATGTGSGSSSADRTVTFPSTLQHLSLMNLDAVPVGDVEVESGSILLTGPNLFTEASGAVARCKFTVYTTTTQAQGSGPLNLPAAATIVSHVAATLPSKGKRGALCVPPVEATAATPLAAGELRIVDVQFAVDGVDFTPAGTATVKTPRYAIVASATSALLSATGISLNNGHPLEATKTPVTGHVYSATGHRVLFGAGAQSSVRLLVTTGVDTTLTATSGNTATAVNGKVTFPSLTIGTLKSTSTAAAGSTAVLVPTIVGQNALRRSGGEVHALVRRALSAPLPATARNVAAATALLRHRSVTRGSAVGVDMLAGGKLRYYLIRHDGTRIAIGADQTLGTTAGAVASHYTTGRYTLDPNAYALNIVEEDRDATTGAITGFKVTGTPVSSSSSTAAGSGATGTCTVARAGTIPSRIEYESTDPATGDVTFLALTARVVSGTTRSFVVERITRSSAQACAVVASVSSDAVGLTNTAGIEFAEFLTGSRLLVVTSDNVYGTSSSLAHVLQLPTTTTSTTTGSTTTTAASWQIRNKQLVAGITGVRQSGEQEITVVTSLGVHQVSIVAEEHPLTGVLSRASTTSTGTASLTNVRVPRLLDSTHGLAPPDTRYHVSATMRDGSGGIVTGRVQDIHFVSLHDTVSSGGATVPASTTHAAQGTYLTLIPFPDPVVASVTSPAATASAGAQLTVQARGFIRSPWARCRVASDHANVGATSLVLTPAGLPAESTVTAETKVDLSTTAVAVDCGTIPASLVQLGRPLYVQVSNDGVNFGVPQCMPLASAPCPTASAITGVSPSTGTTAGTTSSVPTADPNVPVNQQVGFFFNGATVADCASLIAKVNEVIVAAGLAALPAGSTSCVLQTVPASSLTQGTAGRRSSNSGARIGSNSGARIGSGTDGARLSALQQSQTGVVVTAAFATLASADAFRAFRQTAQGQVALGNAGAQSINVSSSSGAADTSAKSNDEGLTGPEIAGIVIACVAVVAAAAAAAWWFAVAAPRRKQKRSSTAASANTVRSIPTGIDANIGASSSSNNNSNSNNATAEDYGSASASGSGSYDSYDYSDYSDSYESGSYDDTYA